MSIRIFGSPPIGVIVQGLLKDSDFIDDARFLVDQDQEKLNSLGEALRDSKISFLDDDDVREISVETLESDGVRVARIVSKINSILQDSEEDLDTSFKVLANRIKKDLKDFDADEQNNLISVLENLVVRQPAFVSQQKAEVLAEITGKELLKFDFICDLRPILNEDRDSVKGVLPMTTLQIELNDELQSVIGIRLTENQLLELEQKVTTAREKIRLLKEFAASTSLPIPNTNATIES